jgi:hypothetical protein
MTRWLLAAIIGSMIAALHYGPRLRATTPRAPLVGPALLRTIAATMLAALLLRAVIPGGAPLPQLVALDVSSSWMRGGVAGSRWAEAVQLATSAAAGDSMLLVGDSLRLAALPPSRPTDATSSARSAGERGRREGRSVLLITDGEGGQDPGSLPAGSRVVVLRRPPIRDLAIESLELPERAAPGDTVTVRLTALAGSGGSSKATILFTFGGIRSVEAPVEAIDSLGERTIEFRFAVPAASGPQIVRAIARMPNDPEPANDTVASVIEVTRTPVAVLVSSAPDPDARDVLEALRGALAAPPVGYYRVAPGQWRSGASLHAVSETEVRRALIGAPLAVIHGDTALLGAPSAVAHGSLILMTPGTTTGRGEWRATPTPDSPVAAALAGIAWDSVPPIDPAPGTAKGDWVGLGATAVGGSGGLRAVVAGSEVAGRRRVVVAASGMWRWRARGGVPGDAYNALWGALIDWVGRTRSDARSALPEATVVREGDAITWRRGGADTAVTVILRRRDRAAREDTLRLVFSGGSTTTQSPPLSAGEYTATVPGGSAPLIVNRSREWVPARQTVRALTLPGKGPRTPAVPLRDRWWPYAVALAALCGEWVWRRRVGLR